MDASLVFELMDLFLVQTYHEAIRTENLATVELWRHIEQHGKIVDPMSTHGETREDLLDKKIQATRGVIFSGITWHSWRRAWFRIVP